MSKRRRTPPPPQADSKPASPQIIQPVMAGWQTPALRVWLVLMLAATFQLTWPLWSDRAFPPLLPLIEWPPFDHFGTILVVTTAMSIFWPRTGLAASVLVGLVAITADQTRMQPQLFSFWLLLLALLPQPVPQFIGRCHLASLWFFSGFHKLLSPGYYRETALFLWQGMFPPADWPNVPNYAVAMATVMAVVELLLGVAVCVPRLRRPAAVVIVVLHCGVVWLLQRHGNWNTSVWPWNLALAVVGAALVVSWKGTLADERRKCGTPAFVAGLMLFASPLLFYVGLLDAYLSHCLYSANVPSAVMVPVAAGSQSYRLNGTEGPYWSTLNVPQPPAHRNFEQYFRRVAQPGDRMEVEDPRWWAAWTGWDHYRWQHTGTAYERIRLSPRRQDLQKRDN